MKLTWVDISGGQFCWSLDGSTHSVTDYYIVATAGAEDRRYQVCHGGNGVGRPTNIGDPFAQLQDAKNYCEVCYQMGLEP